MTESLRVTVRSLLSVCSRVTCFLMLSRTKGERLIVPVLDGDMCYIQQLFQDPV